MTHRARGAGRRGALAESRELVAIASSMSEAGDSLSVEAISARLGISQERAGRLVEMLVTARTTSGTGLPLVDEGTQLTLLCDTGARGRPLRLNDAESTALLAALDRMGIPPDDPLRESLRGALSPSSPSEGIVRQMLGRTSRGSGTLRLCSKALAEGRNLLLSYHGARGAGRTRREVRPEALRHEDGHWYLDAYDLLRHGRRTFRVDRMADVSVSASRESGGEAGAEMTTGAGGGPRLVLLRFSDPRCLDALPWHDLTVEGTDDRGNVLATIPYYGGMWLPRMIAACGSSVSTSDREVRERARGYARSQLCGERTDAPPEGT